jgi:autotransporter-associated beta strand protein
MELSAVNSYTGATVVSSGALIVSGTLSGSAVTVNGGTLLGNGSIAQSVTVNTGATLAPGLSPGILDTGALNLAVGSTLAIELNGTTVDTQYDQVNVTGAITLGGALSLSVGYGPAATDKFWIGLNDGVDPILGAFSNVPVTDIPNNAGIINVSGVDYTVYYGADFTTDATTGGNDILVVVPEPGSAVMLMSGIGMLLGLQRRRRK